MKQRKPTKNTWKLPLIEFFKSNFDGALFENDGAAGIGVVIWNSHGAILASLAENFPMSSSVSVLEMLAGRRAGLFAKEIRINYSIF